MVSWRDIFITNPALPVAGVGEETEDGGEEDDGDGEDEVLPKVPLAPEGAEGQFNRHYELWA